MSNYEMEMKPLMRMDSYMQEIHTQKRHYSKGGGCRSVADEHRGEERGFGVQRLRSKSQNKENFRPASSAEPTVQKLENLRFGDKAEPRLLRWDLTFSPPQKSLPVALESEEDSGDALKSSTVSEGIARGIPVGKPGAVVGLSAVMGGKFGKCELSSVCASNPLSSLLPSCWTLVWGVPVGTAGFSLEDVSSELEFCSPAPGPAIKFHYCWEFGGKAAGAGKALVMLPWVMATELPAGPGACGEQPRVSHPTLGSSFWGRQGHFGHEVAAGKGWRWSGEETERS